MSHLTAVAFAAKVSETEALMRALQGLGLEPEYHENPVRLESHYTKINYDKNKTLANIVIRSASLEKAFGIAPSRYCDIGFTAVGGRYQFIADGLCLGDLRRKAVTTTDVDGNDIHFGINEAIMMAFTRECGVDRLKAQLKASSRHATNKQASTPNIKISYCATGDVTKPSLILFESENTSKKTANYGTTKKTARTQKVTLSR